jgi:beta-lactamase superfamily II metal-dependent hydrolase
MTLQMAVFNVGRGLCVAFITPNRYLILVDCGSSEDFSPVRLLRDCQTNSVLGQGRLAFTPWANADLAYFMITHPHSDHISDIENLRTLLKPSIIIHRPDLDWQRVGSSNRENRPLESYRRNFFWPWDYYHQVVSQPALGGDMSFQYYWLPLDLISAISSTDTDYVNNSSYVSVIKYAGRTIALTGDMTAEGMKWLLAINSGFRSSITGNAIRPGVDILVAPHHGHPNGFCSEWFDNTGPTRYFNIVSERTARPGEQSGQTQVDSRYSQREFSLGQNQHDRRMFSTRTDGSVLVWIGQDGTCTYETIANR